MQQMFNKTGTPLFLYAIRFAQSKGDWVFGSDPKKQYVYGKEYGTIGRHGASRVLLIDVDPAAARINARRVVGRKFEKWSPAKRTLEEATLISGAVLLNGGEGL